jgi:hypothetical protein
MTNLEATHANGAIVFLPRWTAKVGPLTESGSGLLPSHLFAVITSLDSFILLATNYSITVNPKLGKVFTDKTLSVSTSPGELVWCRSMRRDYSDEPSSRPSYCVCYRIGIKTSSGRVGYRIYEDGRAVKGIEDEQ